MHMIDMQTWPRSKHFKRFSAFHHPHLNMCANVDLSNFYPFLKQHGIKFTVAIVYIIPEFRYRIRQGAVVEHEVVHLSTTILANDDTFSFCTLEYTEDFARFAEHAVQQITYFQEHRVVENVPGKDDLLYMTAIPWVSFTSFMHPIHLQPADSIPRFAWGKFFEDGSCLKMPLGVQGHYALMDGIHMARFYAEAQSYLDRVAEYCPESVPGEVRHSTPV